MADIVYILTNEAMPGLIKIGYTNVELASRIKQLYSTGVPLPFELFYACEVQNGPAVEDKLHDAFGDHRISKNREFFRLAPERAKAALSLAEIKEVKLGDEIFENTEVKAEVEAAKRRSRFRLSMIGIVPGTELLLAKDPTIICTTVDDGNKVDYLGDITSLSLTLPFKRTTPLEMIGLQSPALGPGHTKANAWMTFVEKSKTRPIKPMCAPRRAIPIRSMVTSYGSSGNAATPHLACFSIAS